MNKNVAEIIDALAAHQDHSSIEVLEELGTNSPDNEVREYKKAYSSPAADVLSDGFNGVCRSPRSDGVYG